MMIKVQNNTATRDPLPAFLRGLAPESLADLSWITDEHLNAALGGATGWWPEQYHPPIYDADTHKLGAETLTIDAQRRIVVVSHEVVALTADEIAAALAAAVAALVTAADRMAKDRRDAVVVDVSAAEMASWSIKRAEALAWLASGLASDAPSLSAEATARGVTLADLVDKVLTKAQALAALEAAIAGRCGAIQDAARAAASLADLAAIDVDAGWPL